MANCGEDFQTLKRCVIGLAKDIDYKNKQLFDMESKMEKKDMLLKEGMTIKFQNNFHVRSEIRIGFWHLIGAFLLERKIISSCAITALKERQSLRLQLEKLKHEMENQKRELHDSECILAYSFFPSSLSWCLKWNALYLFICVAAPLGFFCFPFFQLFFYLM